LIGGFSFRRKLAVVSQFPGFSAEPLIRGQIRFVTDAVAVAMDVGNGIAGNAVLVCQAGESGIGRNFPFAGSVELERGVVHGATERRMILQRHLGRTDLIDIDVAGQLLGVPGQLDVTAVGTALAPALRGSVHQHAGGGRQPHVTQMNDAFRIIDKEHRTLGRRKRASLHAKSSPLPLGVA
jgi:hypothetical protein